MEVEAEAEVGGDARAKANRRAGAEQQQSVERCPLSSNSASSNISSPTE